MAFEGEVPSFISFSGLSVSSISISTPSSLLSFSTASLASLAVPSTGSGSSAVSGHYRLRQREGSWQPSLRGDRDGLQTGSSINPPGIYC